MTTPFPDGDDPGPRDIAAGTTRSTALALDWIERLFIAGFFAAMLFSRREALEDPDARAFFLLYAMSEGLVVLFVLARRHARDVSTRAIDWIAAIGATLLPQLVQPGGNPLVPLQVGASLVLLGMVTQISAKLILRRSMGMVAANRGVKVGGPYRLVRHPMYAGYLLSHVGLLLLSPLLFNVLLYVVVWTLQLQRIRAEERLLTADPTYRLYQSRVRHRLIPGLY